MAYFLHLLTMVALTLPTVLGYNVVFGKGKILHFGHTGTAIVSAYSVILLLQSTESWMVALFGATIIVSTLSILFAGLALKMESDGFGILSLAVHLSLLAFVLTATDITRGALGIAKISRFPGLESPTAFAVASVLLALGFIALSILLDRSAFGRSLTALAENRYHAESLGISRRTVFIGAFLFAGLGALLTNALFPQYLGLLHPSDYGFPALVFIVMCVVAGGPGSVRGVIVSTVLLVLLREGLRFIDVPPDLRGPLLLLFFGVILTIAVFLRRDTIFPKQRSV